MTENQKGSARHVNAADEILGPPLARGQGNDVAILFGDAHLTFAELNAQANRFGNAFKPHLRKGDRALLMLKDSPEFVAAFLGLLRIGAVAVPVNSRAAAKDLAFILQDSGAEVLLIEAELLPLLAEATPMLSRKPGLVVVRGAAPSRMCSAVEFIRESSCELATEPTTADEVAYMMYTSGTTGTPKGAMHCHGGVATGDACMKWLGMGPGERIFSVSKMFFAYGMAHALIGALRFGTAIIPYEDMPDAAAVAAIVERYRPTLVATVPTMYRNLLRDGYAKQPAFKTVRHYLSSGEGLPESLYNRWLEETGVAILDGLGATETIFQFILSQPGQCRAGATGKPAPYAEVKLLDEQGQPITTADTRGVAWVKMGSVCRGYWRQPDKTQAAFRDGWFRTGDIFTIDSEGWWHHHGRGDDQLKISGQWVNPMEIEECAVSVPGVTDAAAIGIPDADGLVRLTLFLVPDGRSSEELEKAVREKLLATLSIYKCPRNLRFVEAIPRTVTGKLQRYRLRQMAESQATSSTA